MNQILEDKIKLLPEKPGVYKMLDSDGNVIYVGKAKILKNRVRQYFQSSKNHSPKVLAMVSHIADFETIVVNSETEALSLESNLIKSFLPKYNILLKDDKHFPYFRIDMRADYPRIEIVRKVKQDGATYLGPFITGPSIKDELRFIYDLYPVRHCKKNIEQAITRRERPCLNYHIGKCCAPCSGQVDKDIYHGYMKEIIRLMDGKSGDLLPKLESLMTEYAESMEFEKAAIVRDKIKSLRALSEKQVAITVKGLNADVFAGKVTEDDDALVFALYVRNGKVIGTHAYPMESGLQTSAADLLSAFLMQYYIAQDVEIPHTILLSEEPADMNSIQSILNEKSSKKIVLAVPQKGEKKELTLLALKNANDLLQKNAALRKKAWERDEGALKTLSEMLGLNKTASRIECFDNSHLFGTNTVSSMVVFTNGKPDKQEYRHYRLNTVNDGDDLQAMHEVLTRRFSKDSKLPDLLLLDGGKTQLGIGMEVLKETNHSDIPIAALAETEEWIYLPDNPDPIIFPRNSASLHLVERIRDEAHRFAISYHRNLRSKSALYSQLDQIPGIGEKRKRALFDAFLTNDSIRNASLDQLKTVKGMNEPSARAVYQFYHQDQT